MNIVRVYATRQESDAERDIHLQMLAEFERQEAYKAVALAIANHKPWGWTSIVSSIRLWLTRVKLRLGFKLWP